MASGILQPRPLTFADINPKDQRTKIRKRHAIQTNWRCDIEDAIPTALKPRISTVRGAKEKLGSSAPAAPWWQWSVEVLTKLDALSAMTAGKLVFAQELMALEVRRMQQDWTIAGREAVELLRSDVERFVKDLRERNSKREFEVEEVDDADEAGGAESDDGEDEDEDGMKEDGDHDANAISERTTAKAKAEPTDTDADMAVDDEKISTTNGTASTFNRTATPMLKPTRGKHHLRAKAQIASLRGDAMRLRQEAAKKEAEAFELEAKMLRAEAKELIR